MKKSHLLGAACACLLSISDGSAKTSIALLALPVSGYASAATIYVHDSDPVVLAPVHEYIFSGFLSATTPDVRHIFDELPGCSTDITVSAPPEFDL